VIFDPLIDLILAPSGYVLDLLFWIRW